MIAAAPGVEQVASLVGLRLRGRAIALTTVTLSLGFAPSDYCSSRIFGAVRPMTLLVALPPPGSCPSTTQGRASPPLDR